MTEKTDTILFDPGYARHTTILSISSKYLYDSINKFKIFNQRKIQFKLRYSQIINMAENNVGFCLGCLLWAIYIKSLGDLKITGNPCLGSTYDKDETVEEVDFSIEFFSQIKKDAKYYLNIDYQINPEFINILEIYREFLILNKSFVNTNTTNDVILPTILKTPEKDDLEKIYTKIQEVIKSGKLLDLLEVWSLVK